MYHYYVKIKASDYKDFVSRVKELAKENGKGALMFMKAVGKNAVFKDEEGNKFYYEWEKAADVGEDLSNER
jgi:hypothetical protein